MGNFKNQLLFTYINILNGLIYFCQRLYFYFVFLPSHLWKNFKSMVFPKIYTQNEFHKDLDMDFNAVMCMQEKELQVYCENLTARRQKAHEEDLERNE